MKAVRQLVRVQHGSHLYGTATASSDQDFKGVHLPSGRAILLQSPEEVIQRNVESKLGGKNTADAIDDQSFSLQKFFDMLMKGDTVATEILFAPPLEADPLWEAVRGVGAQLLNRQCKGFVGYCVRQAAKYGIKGSRMNAVKRLLSELEHHVGVYGPDVKLGTVFTKLRPLVEAEEHMSFEAIPHLSGDACIHVVCCDRKMPETVALGEAVKVYEKVWQNYGERARAAASNEGIDWKAVSHAVRVARQAIELLETGKITFPRPDAEELLFIKSGFVTYAQTAELLEQLVAQVQATSAVSILPEASDRPLADAMVLRLYLEQVQP